MHTPLMSCANAISGIILVGALASAKTGNPVLADILGLKGLTHPQTAPWGNLLAAVGMLVAVVTGLVNEAGLRWELIIAGLIIGGSVGALLAFKIQMTAMPQLVALFNGFGGGASLLTGAQRHQHRPERGMSPSTPPCVLPESLPVC